MRSLSEKKSPPTTRPPKTPSAVADTAESLALAPVSVIPEYQRSGVGTRLVTEALSIAKAMGFQSVIVLGLASYYPHFGLRPAAAAFGIACPFGSDHDASFMALALADGALDNVSGSTVEYPSVFS